MTINKKKIVGTDKDNKPIYELNVKGSKRILAYAMAVTNSACKLDKGVGKYTNLDLLAIPIINLFTSKAVNYKADVMINDEIRKEESKQKDTILANEIKEGQKNNRIWYIASGHNDCASDHKPYQSNGYKPKFYVDENWREYDLDGSMGAFITKHDIKTIQWVTGRPVWFVTRPHCRHYFRQYSWEEIQNRKYRVPHKKVGEKAMQTPAGASLEYYQDRLKYLEALYKVRPTALLKRQIDKTKLLIKKWKGLL